jgi:DNA-binding transcriptional MocR family regulator
MPKVSRGGDLPLGMREERTPLFRWFHDALRDAVVSGQLRPGGRVPSTRDLAIQYGVSRGVVISAFERLVAEGGRTIPIPVDDDGLSRPQISDTMPSTRSCRSVHA